MFEEFTARNVPLIDARLGAFIDKGSVHGGTLSEFYSYIRGYAFSGGKRLRPLAFLMAYFACGGKEQNKALQPSIALELDHTHSLILDDMMDEDDLRRGQPAVHARALDYFRKHFRDSIYSGTLFGARSKRFSASYASMLANITWILARNALIQSDYRPEMIVNALSVMETTDQAIYHGQMLDMLYENLDVQEKDYLEMIALKTSVLFGMAFELGSLFAGAPENIQHDFKELGIASAMAFQLQDDLLDLSSGKGHEIGSDIRKGKRTLIVMKALERSDENQKKTIARTLGDQSADAASVEKVIRIMHDTGAILYVNGIAEGRIRHAKKILKSLCLDQYYEGLFSGFIDYMLERKK